MFPDDTTSASLGRLGELAGPDQPAVDAMLAQARARVFDRQPRARRGFSSRWPIALVVCAIAGSAGAAAAGLSLGPFGFTSSAPDRDPGRSAAVLGNVKRELGTAHGSGLQASSSQLVTSVGETNLYLVRGHSTLCLATATAATPPGKTNSLACSSDPDPSKPLTIQIGDSASASIMADDAEGITATTTAGPAATVTRSGNVVVAQARAGSQIDVISWHYRGARYSLDLGKLRAREQRFLKGLNAGRP